MVVCISFDASTPVVLLKVYEAINKSKAINSFSQSNNTIKLIRITHRSYYSGIPNNEVVLVYPR